MSAKKKITKKAAPLPVKTEKKIVVEGRALDLKTGAEKYNVKVYSDGSIVWTGDKSKAKPEFVRIAEAFAAIAPLGLTEDHFKAMAARLGLTVEKVGSERSDW